MEKSKRKNEKRKTNAILANQAAALSMAATAPANATAQPTLLPITHVANSVTPNNPVDDKDCTSNVTDSQQKVWFSSQDVQYVQQYIQQGVVSSVRSLASVTSTTPPKRIVNKRWGKP